MRDQKVFLQCILLCVMVACAAVYASAQDSTEVYGFFQNYKNFELKTGYAPWDLGEVAMNGGGFGIAYNFAPWFALWTQFTFYGTEQPRFSYNSVDIINNLQGVRYQTRQYGPVRFYAKGGLGFSSIDYYTQDFSLRSSTFSACYGGGAQLWATEHFGLFIEGSHIIMGLPNYTDLDSRERWDSGLSLTTGAAVRF
jgi:hypothetical protein